LVPFVPPVGDFTPDGDVGSLAPPVAVPLVIAVTSAELDDDTAAAALPLVWLAKVPLALLPFVPEVSPFLKCITVSLFEIT